MQVLTGTSGYSYKEWKGRFYPEKLRAGEMLAFYARRLPAVEINNTFYRMPKTSVLASWSEQVPDAFRFSIKASQRITHHKRLNDAEQDTAYLVDTLATLGDNLGVILFQLPPYLRKDVERLARFLELLPSATPTTFEFRHPSWFDDEVDQLLRDHNCAWCIADTDDNPHTDLPSTADWGYVRLRRENYSQADLEQWAQRIRDQSWETAYVFFKHEDECAGPELAQRFLGLISG